MANRLAVYGKIAPIMVLTMQRDNKCGNIAAMFSAHTHYAKTMQNKTSKSLCARSSAG